MHDAAVDELPSEAFTRGIKELSPRRRNQSCLILGFDCEYDSRTQEIVCYQLSDGAWEHSALIPRTEDFSWNELGAWVRTCVSQWGYAWRDWETLMLVSHFSTAELSHVKDFWLEANVRRVSPQQVYNAEWPLDPKHRLYVMDQYHFFNTSLAKVANTFGEEKLEYDTSHVTRASLLDPAFEKYSLWDAVVCARIFTKFRERLLAEYNVDVVQYPTPASLAMAIYRQHFIARDLPAPIGRIRRQAWLSLWGGRAEAFKQGDFFGAYTLRDVKSLYPSSVLLLDGLPAREDWVERDTPASWKGLCRVIFRFPDHIQFPCLPVYHDGKLIFPLRGISDCTLDEALVARDILGAELKFTKVFEYDHGDRTLVEYMRYFIREKDRAEREGDKVGRELSKLMMNALIGKFSQHRGEVDIEDLKKAAEDIGVPLQVLLSPSFYDPRKPRSVSRIGGHIMPEWSALILGKARAVMAELLHVVQHSLICSTDSLLVPDVTNELVDTAMGRVGVILTSKNDGLVTSRVRVVRNRAYAAEDATGRIVFGAAHAVHLSRRAGRDCEACKDGSCRDPLHDSLRFVLSDVSDYTKTQRAGLKTAVRTGVRFFDEKKDVPMNFKREWDNKRRLLEHGESRPWVDIHEYEREVV